MATSNQFIGFEESNRTIAENEAGGSDRGLMEALLPQNRQKSKFANELAEDKKLQEAREEEERAAKEKKEKEEAFERKRQEFFADLRNLKGK